MDRPGRQPGDAGLLRPGGSREAAADWNADHNDGVVVGDLGGGWWTVVLDRVQRDPVGGLEYPELFGRVRFGTEVGVEPARLASIGACELGGVRVGGYAEDFAGAAQ